MLSDDRKTYIPPASISLAAGASASAREEEGELFTKGTVDAYIAAIIEL
jgi:hypothetical protein